MTPLREIETHKGLREFFGDGLYESLRHIVGTQFRNCATIGGSIYTVSYTHLIYHKNDLEKTYIEYKNPEVFI